MGIIQPPWVSKRWFMRTPFNYCDHFGDKEELALMCKICKDEIARLEKYKKEGKDPYDWKNVFEDLSHNFALTMAMLQRDAKKMGIDLNNLPDEPEPEKPNPRRYKIHQLAEKYGKEIEKIIKSLEYVPVDANKQLLIKAVDVLSHSRSYVAVKIYRAISSRWEESKDKIDREIADSKTSALFAWMGVERNSRVLYRLANHKPLILTRRRFLKMSKTSLDLAELIKSEFFLKDKVKYEEFGCDSYNKVFPKFQVTQPRFN